MRLREDPLLVSFSISCCVFTRPSHTKDARKAVLHPIARRKGTWDSAKSGSSEGQVLSGKLQPAPPEDTGRGRSGTASTQWHPRFTRSFPPGKKFSPRRNPDKASTTERSSLTLHFLSVVTQDVFRPPLSSTDPCCSDWGLRTSSAGITGSCWKFTPPRPPRTAEPGSALQQAPR